MSSELNPNLERFAFVNLSETFAADTS